MINIYIAILETFKSSLCINNNKNEWRLVFNFSVFCPCNIKVHVHELSYLHRNLSAIWPNDACLIWKCTKYPLEMNKVPQASTLLLQYAYTLTKFVCDLTRGNVSSWGFNLDLELVWAGFVYPKYLKSEPISLLVLNSLQCLFPSGQAW